MGPRLRPKRGERKEKMFLGILFARQFTLQRSFRVYLPPPRVIALTRSTLEKYRNISNAILLRLFPSDSEATVSHVSRTISPQIPNELPSTDEISSRRRTIFLNEPIRFWTRRGRPKAGGRTRISYAPRVLWKRLVVVAECGTDGFHKDELRHGGKERGREREREGRTVGQTDSETEGSTRTRT